MLKDFYQLPADKPVEHLSICLLVQVCQDQQNHSGVGLNLPCCLLSNSVFSKFFSLIFNFCCDFPASSRDKVHAEWSSCLVFHIWHSNKQKNMWRGKSCLQRAITALPLATTGHRWREDVGVNMCNGMLGKAGKFGGHGPLKGKGMGCAESQWQGRNWAQTRAVQASMQLPGSVPGLLGCHGIPGLRFKPTSTDLWAGWGPIKPAANLHGGSPWNSAKLWNSSWALSWFF